MTDAPTITLAGKPWPIPELAPRQLRIVVPGLVRLQGLNTQSITADQMDAIFDVVLAAVRRAHPDTDREAFMDWPISTAELLAALPVIATQAGMLSQGPEKDAAPGEASPSIGTG